MIAAALVLAGIAYHLLAIAAAVRFRLRKPAVVSPLPVSILKPVRGKDTEFYRAIRSHALLEYGAPFEILFGVSDRADPAAADIKRLQQEFPKVSISVIETRNDAPNGKVGSLEILAAHARYDVLVLNDSDICVRKDYLQRVVGPLSSEGVGLVTCLYRACGYSFPAEMEALGVATEFAPSVLVADMLSASAFAFGSTIALRRSDLERIGNFAAIRNYLADDYQMGARIHTLGRKVALSDLVVETGLGDGNWAEIWKHQLRWSRAIRVSNPAGHIGYGFTQLTLWCLLACLVGYPQIAAFGFLVRLLSACVSLTVLEQKQSFPLLWAVFLRDLFGTAVWAASVAGSRVEWRGLQFVLRRDGTIERAD